MYYPLSLFSSTQYRVSYTTTSFLDYTFILADHKHKKHEQQLKINGLERQVFHRSNYSIVWSETIITQTIITEQTIKIRHLSTPPQTHEFCRKKGYFLSY